MNMKTVVSLLLLSLFMTGCQEETSGKTQSDAAADFHDEDSADFDDVLDIAHSDSMPEDISDDFDAKNDATQPDGVGDWVDDEAQLDTVWDLNEIDVADATDIDGQDAVLDVMGDLDTSDGDAGDTQDEDNVAPNCPPVEALLEPSVKGTVFQDNDENSDSLYDVAFSESIDSGLEGVSVSLIGPSQERTTTTCPDGRFAFGETEEGVYLLDLAYDELKSTTCNSPVRYPEAVREGSVTIVTLGDSIPSYGAEPYFPARFATLLEPLATVVNHNLAVPGTTTEGWMPETNRFQNEVLPLLPEADLVVISLGGNDIGDYFEIYGSVDPEDMIAKAEGFPGFVEEVEQRLVTIIEAIRTNAPQADIVYIIYPNYGHTSYWMEHAGSWADTIHMALQGTLIDIREHLSAIPGLVLMDMLEAVPGGDYLDTLLSDPLHLNEAGTIFWARQLFLVLGGVIVSDDESLGMDRFFGFSPPVSE